MADDNSDNSGSDGTSYLDILNNSIKTAGQVYQYVSPAKASAPKAAAPAAASSMQKYLLYGGIGLVLLVVLGFVFGGRRGS